MTFKQEGTTESQFSTLKRAAMLSVLQECTDALAVYQYTLKKPSMRTDIDIDCIPPEVRYCNLEKSKILPNYSNDIAKYIQVQEAFEKIRHNSLYVERLMEDAKEAVRTQGCLDTLLKEVQRLIEEKRKEDVLINENDKLNISVMKLQKIIVKEAAEFSKRETSLKHELYAIKERKSKLEAMMSVESKYVNAWERARREQNYIKCSESLKCRNMNLKQCFIHEKNENRITAKIEAFLRQNVTFNEKQTAYWLQRYQAELETYEKDIHFLNDKIEIEEKNTAELKKEFDNRQEFIDSYLAEKEVIKKQKDLKEHMQRSAIKIQAWWRGVMVRRKLGPYRPEEKKKKRTTKAKK